MTVYSRADLAARVLRDLGLVAAEESPSADDLAFAEETISSVYGELAMRGIALPNGSDAALPGEFLVAVSKRIALDVATAFGLISVSDAELAKPVTERALREMAMRRPTGQSVPVDYF